MLQLSLASVRNMFSHFINQVRPKISSTTIIHTLNKSLSVNRVILALKFQRLLSTSKYSESNFNFYFNTRLSANVVRSISTKEEFDCYHSSNDLDTKTSSLLDEEDDSNQIPSKSVEKFYFFRDECMKQGEFLETQLRDANRTGQMTNQEWETLKQSVLKMTGTINQINIDATIMKKCAQLNFLHLGKSFFKYLKGTQKLINRATYGNYLLLFFYCENDRTSNDLNEIKTIYKELLEVYPLLDNYTAEKAICALSLTDSWKEYESLFSKVKQFYPPSIFVYNVVIRTAFCHQEFELGWNLMEEMELQGLKVPDEVFIDWFQKVKYRKLEEDFTRVLKFFNFFNKKPSDKVSKCLKDAFEELNKEGKVQSTRIARNGDCECCHAKLEPCYISQEEYNELKKAFLNPVIIGKDIFRKTRPEEFREFLEFLKNSAPFQIVVDGLNVAFMGNEKSVNEQTFRLKSVVRHFVTMHKKVLVLGRKHMKNWRSNNMDYIYENANIFLTENVSQDDPFMLYATLYSGLGSCFVSRDMMRGHKFLLADPKLQTIFQKWQATHQYFIHYIDKKGRVNFKDPVSFLQTVQQNSKGDWHVPFQVQEDLTYRDHVDHLHRHWLCMQKKAPLMTHKGRPRELDTWSSSLRELGTRSSSPRELGTRLNSPRELGTRSSSPRELGTRFNSPRELGTRPYKDSRISQMRERSYPVKDSTGRINIKKLFDEDDR